VQELQTPGAELHDTAAPTAGCPVRQLTPSAAIDDDVEERKTPLKQPKVEIFIDDRVSTKVIELPQLSDALT